VAEREGRLTAGEPWFMSAPEWVASLRDVPQTRYYLDNTVEPGGLTIICGHPKTGKSLMALDMMLTMATGSPCGPWHPTEGPLNVGYVDLDGPEAGTLHRLEAFSAHRGIAIPSTLKMYRSRRLQLLEKGVAETLLEEVKQHELHVLTIDTLFRSYGGDENSSKDLKRYIDVLDQLMSEAGVAIMLVHHLRKPAAEGFRSPDFDPQEGLRGSSALASVYDHIISLQRGRVKALGKELTTVAIQQGKQVPQSWFQVEISEDADHLIYSARHDEPSEWSVPSRRFGGGE
jgi:RecA-family ATPase